MPASTVTAAELVPEDVAALVLEPLVAASVVLAAGPLVFPTSRPLSVPRIVGSTPPSFVLENSLIPESDLVFDDVKLLPTERRGLKVISRMSNEVLRASVVALDSVVQTRLVGDIARALDDALLKGTGANDSITGIFAQPGAQSGDLDLSDFDSLVDAMGVFMVNEIDPTTAKWFVNPAEWVTLSKVKDSTGSYLAQPNVSEAAGFRILGAPVIVSTRVPAGKVGLVDMSKVAVARDEAISAKLLTERYAEFDQTAIRVTTRWDLGLLYDEAVLVLTPAAP